MEQLALFALPRKLGDSHDSTASNVAMIEPAKHSSAESSSYLSLQSLSGQLEEAAIGNHTPIQSVDFSGESGISEVMHDTDYGSWSFLRKDEPVVSPHVASMQESKDVHRDVIMLRAPGSTHRFAQLAKDNGIPMWRKDIHHDLLRAVFENEIRAFTRSRDGSKNHTFADIYVDILTQSSKMDKELKVLLLTDRKIAVDVGMIALLINIGRVGENVSCKPRIATQAIWLITWLTHSSHIVFPPGAGLKKYNPIPSLWAFRNTNFTRTLDMENILTIITTIRELEPDPEIDPRNFRDVLAPGSNLVQFLFLVFRGAPETASIPVYVEQGFYDLFCDESVNSKVRANSFLSLIWRYFEVDAGSTHSIDPFKLPLSQSHTKPEDGIREDQDSQEEIDYGARLLCR